MIVDDDPLVRVGLRLLFRSMPEISVEAEASDGAEVLPELARTPVDVILSDVRMRTLNGVAMIASIRDRHPDVRIVLMSSTVGAEFGDHARNAGADAFVPKTAPAGHLRDVIVGSPPHGGHRTRRVLTDRESVVANLVATGANNADISRELNLSVNTVKTYVSRVMTKLDVDNRVQLANLLNERGAQ
ncbi:MULTISPECIES: response regulator [unclassified Agrococcus]|uniref:response regulator transcription factor n=1 Tax=unclassified Agrococcus TaxID=2615065 RepID=UPI00360AC409